MNIPKKLKIGGIKYSVEVVKELENRCGEFDIKNLALRIEKGKPEVMELTFLHEVLHAINNEIKEDTIEFYAQSLYQLIKDNPTIFNSIMKGGENHVSKKEKPRMGASRKQSS